MNTNAPTDGKSTVPRPNAVQIAHSVCSCQHHEELHHAETAEQAKQQAIEAAVEHARASGHVPKTALLTEPAPVLESQPTCGRCNEPIHGTIGDGPSVADERNQPCGCTPTAGVSGE